MIGPDPAHSMRGEHSSERSPPDPRRALGNVLDGFAQREHANRLGDLEHPCAKD